MAILRNTIKRHVRNLIIKKTVFLLLLALALAFLSYITSSKAIVTGSNKDSALIYTLGSVVISLLILVLVAFKIRFFHNLFGKDWTGTVVKTGKVDVGTRWYKDNIRGVNSFVVIVRLDHKNKEKKLIFPAHMISPNVYAVGDKIHMIKGTRYPINLTREAEQHICPMCARDSCYGDFCPDCNLKY